MATIVLADDDRDIRAVAQRMLARAGHDIVPAVDGAHTWQAVQQHHPDLVVSDIDMPNMTGTELCRLMRRHEATRRIPVIFVSGSLIPGDHRAVDQATAVLSKPFLAQNLTSCVDKVLHHGHNEGQQPTICP